MKDTKTQKRYQRKKLNHPKRKKRSAFQVTEGGGEGRDSGRSGEGEGGRRRGEGGDEGREKKDEGVVVEEEEGEEEAEDDREEEEGRGRKRIASLSPHTLVIVMIARSYYHLT